MSIHELSEEQVHTMTLEEKDKWWLANVYKGDMPQLNLRSGLTGMLLGGVLCLTNLYVGIKTGWTLGVGITSVIVSFATFKMLAKLKLGKEMTILENNAMQSIATSAGYMTAPMMASLPAYMMVTGTVIPMWQTFWWIILLSILGVLFAFPLKRRFINDEQLPFPEGRAAGIVLDSLHGEDAKEGIFKAKILAWGALLSALIETFRNANIMQHLKLKFLTLPENWDDLIYNHFTPKIMGTPLKDLTITFESSIVMMATGGLMGIKTAMSLLVGGIVNYFVLAPYLISQGIITGGGFKHITMWSLWGGVAMMTTASLYSFLSKPKMLLEAFKLGTSKSKEEHHGVLEKIELPMWVFALGIPIVGALTVYLGHTWFGVHYVLGVIAIPLVFVFTLIAAKATGLTAITPSGALSKLTQVTYSVLAPGNMSTNLMTAGITSEVAGNASNLLMDIKPSYMLGGKPRHQAIGHILGVIAGAIVAVPVFYSLFNNDINMFTTEKMPLPGASIWKAVAEVLTNGLSSLHPTAQYAVIIGAILGIIIEFVDKKMKGRFPFSAVGLGLAFVLQFTNALSMTIGALIFWLARQKITNKESTSYKVMVDNQETLCAGVIAGGSIIGIILIIIENLVFSH